MAGWGDFVGKISQQFQGRTERLKNEKENLENEKRILQSKQFSASGSRRIVVIDKRLFEINNILINSVKD